MQPKRRYTFDILKEGGTYHETDGKKSNSLCARSPVRTLSCGRGRRIEQEVTGMYDLENFLSMVDSILDTARKRHITGGILISLAALFGGLAVTALTIKNDPDGSDDKENDYEYE